MNDHEALALHVFAKQASKWLAKTGLLAPGQLVTRQDMAKRLPPKRWTLRDFLDELSASGNTATRTAPNPAFD